MNRKFAALADIKTAKPTSLDGYPEQLEARLDKLVNEAKTYKRGKASNPDWRPIGLFLRKETIKQARRKLQDIDDPRDLSELTESLLAEWVKRP